MFGWSVAMTQVNSEHIALSNLEDQGFEVFAPKTIETVFKRGKKIKKESFLFSRYVFVKIVDRWRNINGTKGVVSLLMNEERPLFLNAGDERRLESLRDEGSILIEDKKFKSGQDVTIGLGPFAGFKGIYIGQSKAEREIVLLKMLGGDVKVEMAASDLA